MPLRGNTDPSAQRGPAQRAGARQLYHICCPGAPRATCRDGFPLPPQGRRPGQQASSHPDGPEARAPCTQGPHRGHAVCDLQGQSWEGSAAPALGGPGPLSVGWAASTLLPRGGGRGEVSPGLTPPPRARLHTSPLARLKGPVKKLKRGCLTGKNSKGLSQGCARGPHPPGRGAGRPGLT